MRITMLFLRQQNADEGEQFPLEKTTFTWYSWRTFSVFRHPDASSATARPCNCQAGLAKCDPNNSRCPLH